MHSFDFSEEQQMFREAVRDFAEKELAPCVEECERTETFPREVYRRHRGACTRVQRFRLGHLLVAKQLGL